MIASGGRDGHVGGCGLVGCGAVRPGLIDEGRLTPLLDRAYPLTDTAEGLRRVEQGHARGKVVITIG